MALALLALRFSIALSILAFVFVALIIVIGDRPAVLLVSSGINIAVLLSFYWGLKQRISWVAYLAILFFAFDILSAVKGGFEPLNLLNLVDAVFSFIVVMGLFRWFKELRSSA